MCLYCPDCLQVCKSKTQPTLKRKGKTKPEPFAQTWIQARFLNQKGRKSIISLPLLVSWRRAQANSHLSFSPKIKAVLTCWVNRWLNTNSQQQLLYKRGFSPFKKISPPPLHPIIHNLICKFYQIKNSRKSFVLFHSDFPGSSDTSN